MEKSFADSSESDAITEIPPQPLAPGEIVIGRVVGINDKGSPLVSYPQIADKSLPAISTMFIGHNEIGRQVALLFSQGDSRQPVIMGLIHSPLHSLLENAAAVAAPELAGSESESAESLPGTGAAVLRVDGERVVVEGREEIVLKCGEASITLTKAGKILIRGKYLLNRSTGVNRILGGSVQVN